MSAPKSRLKEKPQAQATEPAAPLPSVPLGPARFYNRELSWLQFNRRVMEEAQNARHPLLERLRFLSISANNIDEFYMVRVAGIYGQIAAGVTTLSQDGLTPAEQLAAINQFVAGLVRDQQACWTELRSELAAAGVEIVGAETLRPGERDWLETWFMTHVFPILTPIAVDPAHPFPFILNRGLTLVVEMSRKSDGKTMNGLIPIPGQLERFIRLRAEEPPVGSPAQAKELRFIRLESMIGLFISELFSGFGIQSQGAFRVLRDSDIELQEEAEDLVRSYETQLKRRRRGHVIRLELDARMPERLQKFVIEELEVGEDAVFVKEGLLGLADTVQLITPDRPDLLFKPFNIRFP
jgi:polyphosphate kinase